MRAEELSVILDSLINGNRKQTVSQIDEYGLYDFWSDFRDYLNELGMNDTMCLSYFSDAVISYFRIKNR